ncbi:diacylglycerol kinase family protein [Aneurinibacillus thermoaerophilus]|uniref:diacylglycerol kinase family protein n=1 Tax=Aneurinibacillus thermoaerophilus TaxID=143495 RepID=UPI002E1AA3EA|nr:diacylglycerol kinase family protein [Aneurinibacillus thermoaerophilus]MED0735765.1 diacylglycerol kinase family protein [Aneurinibacillus thermoaerophilus]MED0764010.1 diacylglycerol kinase family protein [Aneurinibacillus thermoaerophilus]
MRNEWQRLKRSLGHATRGICYTVKTQRNMQIHVVMALLVLFLGWFLAVPKGDVLLVFFSVFLVLILETVNTAIEKTVDLVVGEKRHPLAKVAKDAAAGAVLFAAILSILVGVYVFFEPLWQFIQNGERRMIHIRDRDSAAFFLTVAGMCIFVLWLVAQIFRPEKKEDDR